MTLTIFTADQVNRLVDLRNQLCRINAELYVAGCAARQRGAPELESLLFQIAGTITLARARTGRAIVLAASPPPPVGADPPVRPPVLATSPPPPVGADPPVRPPVLPASPPPPVGADPRVRPPAERNKP